MKAGTRVAAIRFIGNMMYSMNRRINNFLEGENPRPFS